MSACRSFISPNDSRQVRKHDRRQRLLAEAISRHGIPGLSALLDLLEGEFGEALGLDRRLEALIDANPAAIKMIARGHGGRR